MKKLVAWFVLVGLMGVLMMSAAANASVKTRELEIEQFGSVLGEVRIELDESLAETTLKTAVKYPERGVEAHSEFLYQGGRSPANIARYTLAVQAPNGKLDVQIDREGGLHYKIPQLGKDGTLPGDNIVPLDNNTLADYLVLAWAVDEGQSGPVAVNMVVPTLLTQGEQVIPAVVELKGNDTLAGRPARHFVATVAGSLTVDLWTDPQDTLLLKMEIPQQGLTIVAKGLEEKAPESAASIAPAGYAVAEKEVEVPVEGGVLFGTMAVPEGFQGKSRAVVLVAGSGPTDRDGNSAIIPGKINTIKAVSDHLVANGFVTLRYDKRGIAVSAALITDGTPPLRTYVDDVAKAAHYLKSQAVVTGDIFLIGHSEGAYLVTAVAAERDDVAGIALLSGSGVPMGDTVKRQVEAQGQAAEKAGYPPGTASKLMEALNDLYAAIASDQPFDLESYGLPEAFNSMFISLDKQRAFSKGWLTADPAATLTQTNCPVLIIQGDADIQVSVEDAKKLESVVPESRREVHIVHGLDHVLKMTDGQYLPYNDPNRHVDDGALDLITQWLVQVSE